MRKIITICVLLLFVCLFNSCNNNQPVVNDETYVVEFIDPTGNVLKSVEVKEGESISLPEFTCETEGYHYSPKFDLSELENIDDNKFLDLELVEYKKNVKYIIDGEVVRTMNCNYTKETSSPSYDSSKMESSKWELEVSFDKETDVYNFIYTLVYSKKETYYITYYDGDKAINLEPASYKSSVGATLPKYNKNGYEFIGWFPSEISLCMIDNIPVNTEANYNLYARFIKTDENIDKLILPEASNHFTGTQKSDVWAPVLPTDAPESSVLKYTWTVSNSKVLNISSFSSFSIVSTGYSIVTATLISDPTYTINGVFKTTVDDVTLVTEADANKIDLVTVTFKGKNGETINTQKILKGTFAYLPTPPSYTGFAFSGWDKENCNIKEDCIINATYSNTITNNYVGKSFSFIGDSLTSYLTYIPTGYASFFPYPIADVNDINQMWFMKTLNQIGGKLFVNNSEGGTTVQGGSHPTSEDLRLSQLKCGSLYADYTVIFMGANDCAACYKKTSGYTAESFERYYRQMINKIIALCPNTEIMLCSLLVSKLYSKELQASYNVVINKLAKEYNLKLIDFSDVDLTVNLSGQKLIVDNGHPSRLGMDIIAKKFYNELI